MGAIKSEERFQRPNFSLLPIPPDSTTEWEPLNTLRTLPDLVHFNALHNPQHVFCLQSRQSPSTPGNFDFTSITFRQLGCAVESCCSWLLQNVPEAHAARLQDGDIVQKAPPIALFLESDVGLFIYIVALLTLNIPVRLSLSHGLTQY